MTRPVTRYLLLAVALSGCPQDVDHDHAGTLGFGVFGDGPYYAHEAGRYRDVIKQISSHPLDFVIHLGDMLWQPCSDGMFRSRRESFERMGHPVIYTPGDNEWVDCHEPRPGGYDPLERLSTLRRILFETPGRTLGDGARVLTTQSHDSTFAEFVENVRWIQDGIVFATVHVVGSGNATNPFPGRANVHDVEVQRRTEAALAWVKEAFDVARRTDARGLVFATHAAFLGELPPAERAAFEPLLRALEDEVSTFTRPVLLIHGDDHEYIVDHPLVNRTTGDTLRHFTRLETFGSPDIGWVEVMVEREGPVVFEFVSRVRPGWQWW